MRNPSDENAVLAMALVMDARDLLSMVDSRVIDNEEDAGERLRRCMDNIDTHLALLRRGLLHDFDPSGVDQESASDGAAVNPYRRGQTTGPTEAEGLASLSDEDLMEHTRYWYWEYRHATVAFQAWNLWKRYSAARDAVVARGYGHLSWMDTIEERDA